MDVNAKQKAPLFELELNESIFNDTGVNIMSFVDQPAMEMNYLFFNKNAEANISNFELAVAQKDKRIVVGPALIPNKHINRFDKSKQQEFFVYFSEDTVRKASEKFLRTSSHVNSNVQHSIAVDEAFAVESWLVENPEMDKAKHFGFDVPKGTWMVSYKILNDGLWNLIKNGELNGFSIEGSFIQKYEAQMSKVNTSQEEAIRTILSQEKSDDELFDELDKWFNENEH